MYNSSSFITVYGDGLRAGDASPACRLKEGGNKVRLTFSW
jgi:hypothetical protein